MATIEKSCRECGRKLRLSVPESGAARRWAEHLGVLCDECAKAADEASEEVRREQRRRLYAERSGLPANLKGFTWGDIEDREDERDATATLAEHWAAGELNGLLLCGPVGTGKTFLAAVAAWARIQRPKPVRWVSVARLMAMDRAGFGTEEKQEATKLLTGFAPLVLDDLDKVNLTEAVRSILFLAIDNRVQARKPLLVTTNLQPDQLENAFGQPIASRLLGYCQVGVLGGRDRRKAAAA